MNHIIHNSHLLRYPLPAWALVSVIAWAFLPAPQIIALAPWVCGALLVVAGLVLGCVCRAIYSRPEADSIQTMVRLQGGACVATALVGFGIWFGYAGGFFATPTLDVVKTAWLLCSAGFVLSVTVARLMLSFIALLPKVARTSSAAVQHKAVADVTSL